VTTAQAVHASRLIKMQTRAGHAAPPATRLYWACQAVGWGSFTVYALASYAGLASGRNGSVIVAMVIVNAFICPAATHLLRHWMYRRGWIALTARQALWRAAASALTLASAVTLIAVGSSALIVGPAERLSGAPAFWTWIAFLWAFGGWQFIYFAVHARRRHDARELELTLDARNAQLALLRAQLNPHFLFNCLNSVRGLIAERPDRAVAMITSLADLLRYALASDRKQTVTLAQELRIVEEYVSLEQVRFEERLRFEQDVEPGALIASVPPMLVHTLIENAVKHGIAEAPGGGVVRLTATIRGDGLTISVSNTGVLRPGFNEEGYGLRNTMERLILLFGSRATFTLTDAGGTTVATVTLPLNVDHEGAAG
jgi:two-component sensor histidine kinase